MRTRHPSPIVLLFFLGLVERYRKRFDFRLYHYGLMANHFHLLLQLHDPKQLSALMAGTLAGLRAPLSPAARFRCRRSMER